MLATERSGEGPRLVLAHGFTQTARSWGPFAALVAPGRELVRVDLPGHGASGALRADLTESAALLAGAAGEEPVDLLGYSLGARVALHTALAHPGAVRRLVLIGGTAGIEDAAARAARRERDERLAEEAERDVEGFLERWVAAPMFARLADPGLAERRRNTGEGLASSLRLAGVGTQAPLWERLGGLSCPLLTIAGAEDVRFASLASRMAGLAPRAVTSLVPGAGHAAHLAQPRLAALIVRRFLDAAP